MNVQADRTQEGSLSRVAWDDEGVPADQWLIVEKGIFKDYQTTREQVARIQKLTGVTRSHGCSFAESWDARAVPAHAEHLAAARRARHRRSTTSSRPPSAASSSGTAARGRSTISATTSSSRGRRSTKCANGKIVGMLRDVAYQSNTPVFWNSMDMIGGKSSYWMGGAFNDGKGEPSQIKLGEPRLRAGAVPERDHPQHQADVVSAQALAAGGESGLLTREQAKALADRVLTLAARADQTRVNITQRVERQHALRRRQHHDVRRRHRHVGDGHGHGRQAPRVGVDQRARRRVAEADGGPGGAPGAAVARGSGADAGARSADLRAR